MRKNFKRFITICLSLAMVFVLSLASVAYAYNFSQGNGTSNNPYVITTADDLKAVKDNPSAYYVLGADIDFGGALIEPLGDFSGTLDGKGHTISGFGIWKYSGNVGLFSSINYNGKVCNLNLNGVVTGTDNVGMLCGSYNGGSISDIVVEGEVTGNTNVGGICGKQIGSLHYCDNYANVIGNENVGGISGSVEYVGNPQARLTFPGSIDDCKNYGYIQGHTNTGGIAGQSLGNEIRKCGNHGEVDGGDKTGGIVGFASIWHQNSHISLNDLANDEYVYIDYGFVKYSYNVGDIDGSDFIGGIIGECEENYIIRYSYNAGRISGRSFDPFRCAGISSYADCISCYNTGDLFELYHPISGNSCSNCYYVGDDDGIEGTSAKTFEEFKSLARELGSEFENNAIVERPIIKSNREVEYACPHIMTYHPEKEVTCTEDGNPAYYSCSNDCGKNYVDEEGTIEFEGDVVIKALGHHYVKAESQEAKDHGIEGSGYLICLNCLDTSPMLIEGMSGEGSEEYPYVFETPESFVEFVQRYNEGETIFDGCCFNLGCDIIDTPLTVGLGTLSHPFTGYFDGCSHRVKIEMGDISSGCGLFGTTKNAEICNVVVLGNITYNAYGINIGSVVGWANETEISNCASNVRINCKKGNFIGGIVGLGTNTTIRNCLMSGNISAKSAPYAGICGYNVAHDVTIDNCLFTGEFIDCKETHFSAGLKSAPICAGAVVRNSFYKFGANQKIYVLVERMYDYTNYNEESIEGMVAQLGDAYSYDPVLKVVTLIPCNYNANAFESTPDTSSIFGSFNIAVTSACIVVLAVAVFALYRYSKKKKLS